MTTWSVKYNNGYTEDVGAEEYAWICDRLIREMEEMHPFIGDSRDYSILYVAAVEASKVPGMFCEIGLRKGGGAKTLLDCIINSQKERTIISIDPFGSIPFEGMEGEVAENTEYSNAMQKDTLEKMYRFVATYPKINFLFFPLEDQEFFKRYDDGVPTYVNGKKEILNKYALVHFDGPHTLAITLDETKFFINKTNVGSVFVYDDVMHFYNHDAIQSFLEDNGWQQMEKTKVKSSYRRVK